MCLYVSGGSKTVEIGRIQSRGKKAATWPVLAPSMILLDPIFSAIALAFDDDGFASMQDAVEDGGGQGVSLLKISGQCL